MEQHTYQMAPPHPDSHELLLSRSHYTQTSGCPPSISSHTVEPFNVSEEPFIDSDPQRPQPAHLYSTISNEPLIDPACKPRAQTSPTGPKAQFRLLCRTLHIEFLYHFLASRLNWDDHEEPKVAMYKHRWFAFLRCLVHVPAVAVALLLVILNAMEYYIGGELAGPKGQDTQKLAALAFAAKIHELLMLASIGVILFSYIRKQLAFGDGIPLGVIFAGFSYTSVSFLYSSEFLSILFRRWGKGRKKGYLVALVITCCILAVSVGPSSNVLIRPRLDDWSAGGTTFWVNATHDTLFPKTQEDSPQLAHCSTDTGDDSCPYGGWQALNNGFLAFWPRLSDMGSLPEEALVPGRISMRRLHLRFRSGGNVTAIWRNAYSTASVANSAIADALSQLLPYWSYAARYAAPRKHLMFRRDATVAVSASQPLTFARCNIQFENASTIADSLIVSFPALGSKRMNGGDNTGTTSSASFDDYTTDLEPSTTAAIKSLLMLGASPDLFWIDAPGVLNGSQSTLNVLATFPPDSDGYAYLLPCSIDSRLVGHVQMTVLRSRPNIIEGSPAGFDDTGTLDTEWPRLNISAAWARYLNPTIIDRNATIFSQMVSTAGLWNSSTVSMPKGNFPFVVESILATTLANGLSRASFNATMVGTLKGASPSGLWAGGWGRGFLPHTWMGNGGDAFNIDPDEQKTATKLTMRATVTGFAYSSAGATQKASMAVLLLYVLLAVAHYAWSVWTGWTSDSWDSVPEIATLAFNSERTGKLHNTGAGIGTGATYREHVCVRAKDDHVEFVFDDAERRGTYIRPNRAYG